MVFVKGAWVDMPPWDDRYSAYHCTASCDNLYDKEDSGIKGEFIRVCHDMGDKKLDCYRSEWRVDRVIKPSWCPKREKK